MRPNSSLPIKANRGVNHMIHSLSNTQLSSKKPSLGKVLASITQWDRHITTRWMSTMEGRTDSKNFERIRIIQ